MTIHEEYHVGIVDPVNLAKASWQQDAQHLSSNSGVEVVEQPVPHFIHL